MKRTVSSPGPDGLLRCPWCLKDGLYQNYHDQEWGVPVHDERHHFSHLSLEVLQAGLSWHTVLKRREVLVEAMDQLDPVILATRGPDDVALWLQNPALIRSRAKLVAILRNARLFLDLQARWGSFDRFLWDRVEGKPVVNHWTCLEEVPAQSPLSQALSRELKGMGFAFVGPTTLYAHLQSVGLVNDHLVDCYRHSQV